MFEVRLRHKNWHALKYVLGIVVLEACGLHDVIVY
jgi:hypothetical protein